MRQSLRRALPLSTLGLALVASIGAAPARAQSFEGEAEFVTFEDGATAGPKLDYKVKGNKLRADINAGGMQAYMIMDLGAGSMTSVMPAQQMYMVMSFKAFAASGAKSGPAKPPKVTRTGRTETIAGHTCEHVLFESDGHVVDICGAKGMGFMGFPNASGGPMGGRAVGPSVPGGWEDVARTFDGGFFPLKVETVEAGKSRKVLEAVRVEARKLDAALFEVPKGFKEMSIPQMPPRGED